MKTTISVFAIMLVLSVPASGREMLPTNRELTSAASPAVAPGHQSAVHNAGNLAMTITNRGCFGTGYSATAVDCFTGQPLISCEYPKETGTMYLFAGMIWVGGIVGTDTLVSVGGDGWMPGSELNPDIFPLGNILYRSRLSTGPAKIDARSDQDFVATVWDTCKTGCPGLANDAMDGRPHRPLGIRIDQESYVWRDQYGENAVIFNLKITNISNHDISKGYVGIYVDADVESIPDWAGYMDDVTGFASNVTVPGAVCPFELTIPTAWIADNDGDLLTSYPAFPVPHVTATALLNILPDAATVSYNWWMSNGAGLLDFGPMRRSNMRDLGTGGLGTPAGDRNKYWIMGNGDIDYNQVYTASISPTDSVWLPIPVEPLAPDIVDGYDTRYLLSAGPFDLAPGQSIPLVFAYVGGRNFHTNPTNVNNLPYNPQAYEANLNFDDLKRNIVYASWVYDNPGVDSDSDGYYGEFVVCGLDTVWVRGDGVPDFRASAPPTQPSLRVTPESGSAILRWNGAQSEASRDFLTGIPDFEGYNVYLRKLGGASDWNMVASYDVEDYFKAIYDAAYNRWTVDPVAFGGDKLKCLYAPLGCSDSIWSANYYTRTSPFVRPWFPDSILYFVPAGCNAHLFGHETPILKSYPNAPKPQWSRVADVPVDSLPFYVTDDGFFKYYEYEITLTNLTPADSYLVSVTALDYGKASLTEYTPLETPIDDGQKIVVPLARSSCCSGMTGNVDCSPNGSIDIADLTSLIDYLYVSLSPLCCVGEANTDGDPASVIDIADLTRLIDFLYVSFTAPAGCE